MSDGARMFHPAIDNEFDIDQGNQTASI